MHVFRSKDGFIDYGQILMDSLLQMLVYSLGMTLYWSVDFHLPQNQVGVRDKALIFYSVPSLSHTSVITVDFFFPLSMISASPVE